MVKFRISAFLVFSAALLVSPAFAQETSPIRVRSDVVPIFQAAVDRYNRGDFRGARDLLDSILGEDKWHQLLTASLLLHAKASYWLADYAAAQEDLRELLSAYPKTAYAEDVHLLAGLIHYSRNDYAKAVKQFLWVVDFGRSDSLLSQSATMAQILLNDYLEPDEVAQLKRETSGKDGLALLTLAEANGLLAQGKIDEAEAAVTGYVKQNPHSRFEAKLQSFLSDKIAKQARINRVGVLLPLTGDFADAGRGVYRGIKFAEQELTPENNGVRTEIVYKNTESSMTKAVMALQSLVRDANVVCAIGEVENLITAGLAGMSEALELPLLAPVATDNGIAAIGPYIFQKNADLETQARAIARYAIDSLKLRTFVTIAPQDEYGQQMVDAFSEEVDHLGGEIITQRWYYGVPENLTRQFKEIREIAFRRAFEDTARLSLPNFAQLDRDSLWKDFNERFMFENAEKEPIYDLPASYPVKNLDGVFLPLFQEDIQYVARQLTYFNLQAQILGGEYWYLTSFEDDQRLGSYINGAIFVSSYYFNPQAPAYQNFRDRFRKAMGTSPEKWELLGYDTAHLVLQGLRQAKLNRSQVRQYLNATTSFHGLSGQVSFANGRRANKAANILQIQGKTIRKLPFEGQ